ncbi:MAG: GNAT family N-acetyltransferase [Verrucomicrobiota bacterium]|nr:GNAT family N-acetyltransferase [Verrucomicrobiota bacterium]
MQKSYSFPGGSAVVVERGELAGEAGWHRAFAEQGKDWRYYEIIEDTLANDFEYRYLLLRDDSGALRAVQPIFFVQQNLVEGIPGALRHAVDAVRKKFQKFLTMRVLMVGCAAGEGHLGALSSADAIWTATALHECLPPIARDGKASLIVLKDFSSRYREVLAGFSRNGFTRVPSMPATRLQLHFRHFDDYLSTLSHSTRKSLRRKFRKTERAAQIALSVVDDITPFVDEVYPLYLAVHDRSAMKFEKLTKEYLSRLGRELAPRAKFFIWRLDDRIIAFSACVVHHGAIYDEYLGLDYRVALDLSLYFYTIRDILSWAIAHGLKFYFSSPLNYDPKLHLGCELAPLDLYVRHTAPLLNPIFGRMVKLLEPTRHDPVLHKFPNAAELK